jgi:glycine/D-amino acid oxidase-like deaminating enzyme
MHVELLDAQAPSLRFAVDIDDSFQYAMPTGKRSFVYGGLRLNAEERNIWDDTTLSSQVAQRQRRYLSKYFGLRAHQYRVTHEWTGIMGFTPDELPFVGRAPGSSRHFVLAGFSGEGIPRAFMGARCIAQLVSGSTDAVPIPEQFDPCRIPRPVPLVNVEGYASSDPDADEEENEEDEDDSTDEEGEEDEANDVELDKHRDEEIAIAPPRVGMTE